MTTKPGWLRKRAEEAADALTTCSCLCFKTKGYHYDRECNKGEAPHIADAIEAIAREFAERVASRFNCEMDDSEGTMFDAKRKAAIIAAADGNDE